jgi:hypothetical protein
MPGSYFPNCCVWMTKVVDLKVDCQLLTTYRGQSNRWQQGQEVGCPLLAAGLQGPLGVVMFDREAV